VVAAIRVGSGGERTAWWQTGRAATGTPRQVAEGSAAATRRRLGIRERRRRPRRASRRLARSAACGPKPAAPSFSMPVPTFGRSIPPRSRSDRRRGQAGPPGWRNQPRAAARRWRRHRGRASTGQPLSGGPRRRRRRRLPVGLGCPPVMGAHRSSALIRSISRPARSPKMSGRRQEHFAVLRAVWGPHEPPFFHQLHHLGGPVVTDTELPLEP
jgi:hypothetical protein